MIVILKQWKGFCARVLVTDLYIYIFYPDTVPPIHVISYHVATDKPPYQDGDKFRSIFSDNLQPIATRGKKARGTLLVDQQCGNAVQLSAHPSRIEVALAAATAKPMWAKQREFTALFSCTVSLKDVC